MYKYWQIDYISCEENNRWYVVRTPIDWDCDQVRYTITIGGCGDDISEVISITETDNEEYSDEFC